jgi:hypothetical protein
LTALPWTRGTTHASFRDDRRLGDDAAVAEPAPFVAVTMTRSLRFKSFRLTV